MIVSIMQPYFFPYLGYFQLMAASEIFVFHDDVQYIKGGWVNRNRILVGGAWRWLSLPVQQGPSRKAIDQRYYRLARDDVECVLRRVEATYRKASHFAAVFPFIAELLNFGDCNVARFNINLIERIAHRLRIGTRLVRSSAMVKDDTAKGPVRVIDMCRRLGATRYVNPIGGTALYRRDAFAAAGIELHFLRPAALLYRQFDQPSVANLSIIDVMMFNGDEAVASMLRQYRIEES